MKKHLTGVVLTLFLILLGSAPVLAQGGTVHWVQWGDNLASIAARYGVTPQAIMSANGLANPDLIYVGQKLDIPSGGSMSGGSYYTVKPGDTLGNIARQLNTTVAALANANNLSNADTIFVGQVLNVPGGSVAGPDGGYAPVYKCEYYYTVKWGDTLSAIAWYHGLSVNALLQANNLYGDVIFEGQKLCLPGAQKRPVVTAFYHTVQSGDTVTGIAYRYGVSQAAIIQANNLSEAGLIYVGQTLVIPGYRPSAPTPKAKDVPPPPDYVAVEQQSQPEWDGTVTVVKANNQWWGAQTAESPDPNGITTIVVRIVGDDNIPVVIKHGDFQLRGVVGTSAEFGLASFGFKGVPAGQYQVWVDQDDSEVVQATVNPGNRSLVEFKFVSTSEDNPPRSASGWSGRVVSNSGGTTDANGVWSVVIVKGPAIGLPMSIRSEGNDFTATCYTGTKPEYGPGACDFGGLWPGKYTVTLEGAGIAVEVFVDGKGVAEVEFSRQ